MKEISKQVQITLIIVATILILSFGGMYFYKSSISQQNTISVEGQAVKEVIPDLFSVHFSVETKGATSNEAESMNSQIVSELKSKIQNIGLSKDDLKTENYNIYPEYDYSKGQKLTGYKAVHSLKIKLATEKQDKIGAIIDASATAGAGISYISFELSPELEQTSKAEVIKIASTDARIKAESVAEGFNKKLGKLVSVALDNFNYQPWRIYESTGSSQDFAEAKATVADISPSEREVTAYVTAVYKLN